MITKMSEGFYLYLKTGIRNKTVIVGIGNISYSFFNFELNKTNCSYISCCLL